MRIGIDISQIAYKGTGVARYQEGLVKAILENEKTHEWVFFFSSLRRLLDPEIRKRILNRNYSLHLYPFPPTLLSFLWNNVHRIPIERFVGDVDWFITSDWTEPPSRAKKATIINDLVYLRHPQTVDKKIIETQRKRISWVVKESNLIFCISDSTKNDAKNLLHVSENTLRTIYPGVDVIKPTDEQISSTLKKYQLYSPFILSVGKIEPRKNIKRLIEAFRGLNNPEAHLVIVGPSGWEDIGEISDRRIHLPGLVDDQDLFCLYASCTFFIYPSLYEGFGYPVLEAMKLGAPVATSNVSSLKEVAKGSAQLFNPLDINDIKNSLSTLLSDPKLRLDLRKKGLEKSSSFTWKNSYSQMIASLEKYNESI